MSSSGEPISKQPRVEDKNLNLELSNMLLGWLFIF
jgi:hypothetical protein